MIAWADRARPGMPVHSSRGCSQEDLIGTGGDGLFYCFRGGLKTWSGQAEADGFGLSGVRR